MSRHEQLHFIRSAQRVVRALPRTQAVASRFFDWMERNDVCCNRAPTDQVDGTAVSRESWDRLREAIDARARHLASARPDQVARSASMLGDMLELDATERSILLLLLRCDGREGIAGLIEFLVDECRMPRDRAIGLIADVRTSAVRRALAPEGRLRRSGLIEDSQRLSLRELGLEISPRIARILINGARTEEVLLEALFPGAPAAETEWVDFDHLGPGRDLALRLLKGALGTRTRGLNILLYGPPGTGKTEFAKLLAARLGATLHAVGEKDTEGDEPSRLERLGDLLLAEKLLGAKRSALLLFDEMDDLLERDSMAAIFGLRRGTGRSKVHLHRRLEGNRVPVIWTINDISDCDPALLRRMTFSLEIRSPGPTVRERVWRRLTARESLDIGEQTIRQLAQNVAVPPALVSGALRVSKLTKGGEADLTLAIEAAAKALNGGRTPAPEARAGKFDPTLVEADVDFVALARRLSADDAPRDVSFCFHGVPGTGKSALARHLAEAMGLAVHQRRASDLLSKWVGQSEQNIAKAFETARDEGAFLIFDEADSLLGERSLATHGFEISQVNEMLAWMESHPLPIACTTNLAARLDAATLRRFTLRTELRPLSGSRLARAFEIWFDRPAPSSLQEIDGLTPGDFTAISRRLAVLGTADTDTLITLLREEVLAKGMKASRIGFH